MSEVAKETKGRVLKGWLIASLSDENFLVRLGVKIERIITSNYLCVEYGVIVDEETLEKLDPYWGRFIWGLSIHQNGN